MDIIVTVDQEAEVVPQETPGAEQSNTRRTQIVVGASTNTIHHAQAETPCTSGNTMHSAVRRGVMRLYKQFQGGGEVGKNFTGKSLLSIVQQLVSKSCYDSVIAEFKYKYKYKKTSGLVNESFPRNQVLTQVTG